MLGRSFSNGLAPSWAPTKEDKVRCVREYPEREGIVINSSMIRKNPGQKATAKLMLNYFWGKFGENLNKLTTVAIEESASLSAVLSNLLWRIHTVRVFTEDELEMVYSNISRNQLDNGRKPLRGRLQHLPRPSQILRVFRKVKTTNPLLRHGLGYLSLASRSTRHPAL